MQMSKLIKKQIFLEKQNPIFLFKYAKFKNTINNNFNF